MTVRLWTTRCWTGSPYRALTDIVSGSDESINRGNLIFETLKIWSKVLVFAGIAVVLVMFAPIFPGFSPPPSSCSGFCTWIPPRPLYGSVSYHLFGFGGALVRSPTVAYLFFT